MASTSGFHSHNPSAFLLISDIFLQKHRTPAKTSKKVFRPEKIKKKSILENRKVCNGITIVKSAGQKFSPICDRLYPVNNLIVYTDDELNYYGKFSKELYEKYENSYKVYSGGGENGYLLFKKKKLEIEEIKNIIEEIVKYVKSN